LHEKGVEERFKTVGSRAKYPKKWNYEQHTVAEELTDCYGHIKFDPRRYFAKYVRVDFRTPPESVIDIMFNSWKLYRPNMIISVTGGAENISLKKSMKTALVRGITKATLSTGETKFKIKNYFSFVFNFLI
jgi:hypothetical protein